MDSRLQVASTWPVIGMFELGCLTDLGLLQHVSVVAPHGASRRVLGNVVEISPAQVARVLLAKDECDWTSTSLDNPQDSQRLRLGVTDLACSSSCEHAANC